MLELKWLRTFVTLEEHMHFGRAAEALGISQPSLSQQIRSLEDEIGGPIIHRSNRTISLTPLGLSFLEDAKTILAAVERAEKKSADILSGDAFHLRLGVCPGVVSSGILVRILEEVRARFPVWEVETVCSTPFNIQRALQNGTIDASVGVTFSLLFPTRVVTVPIASWDAYLVAHKSKEVQLPTGAWNTDLLRRETYFNFDTGEGSPHIAESLLNVEPADVKSLPSVRLVASYVEAGLGISVIPSPDLKLFGPNTCAYRIPDSRMNVAAMRLVQSNSPALRNFFSMLKEIRWEPSPGL